MRHAPAPSGAPRARHRTSSSVSLYLSLYLSLTRVTLAAPSLPSFSPRVKQTLVHRNVEAPPDRADDDSEESWAGATPKYMPLGCKGVLASIFSLVSAYVAYDGWSTMDFQYMHTFKTLMFLLSALLTIPKLYQTTLMTLTFTALARGAVVEELHQHRSPITVLMYAAFLSVMLPVLLPLVVVVSVVFQPVLHQHEIFDCWLVVVGFIDFSQTLVLIPLAFVVIFSAGSATDIFIDIVAVQVFASLDDEFVQAFSSGNMIKHEALETYCEKVSRKDQ